MKKRFLCSFFIGIFVVSAVVIVLNRWFMIVDLRALNEFVVENDTWKWMLNDSRVTIVFNAENGCGVISARKGNPRTVYTRNFNRTLTTENRIALPIADIYKFRHSESMDMLLFRNHIWNYLKNNTLPTLPLEDINYHGMYVVPRGEYYLNVVATLSVHLNVTPNKIAEALDDLFSFSAEGTSTFSERTRTPIHLFSVKNDTERLFIVASPQAVCPDYITCIDCL